MTEGETLGGQFVYEQGCGNIAGLQVERISLCGKRKTGPFVSGSGNFL